ncbi:MAG TPA: VUT family protein [Acidimicrobiales bacterium]|nr:VUT family protein [Acidimicrobiales bacterium]
MRVIVAVAYVACVVLANVLTEHFGLIPIGFGLLVTAGTFAAGGTLLARNITQDWTGRAAVVVLMLAGCGLSWWLASPDLAVASAVAFLLSESTDMAVFTPLRDRGWSRAVMGASLVGAVVDTFAFLYLAGFPLTADTVTGQLVVKVGISWLIAAAVGVSNAVLRQPVQRARA